MKRILQAIAGQFKRDSQLWRILFYGAGTLWAVSESLMLLTPDQAVEIGISAAFLAKFRVWFLILTAIGGKFGLSPLKSGTDNAIDPARFR